MRELVTALTFPATVEITGASPAPPDNVIVTHPGQRIEIWRIDDKPPPPKIPLRRSTP